VDLIGRESGFKGEPDVTEPVGRRSDEPLRNEIAIESLRAERFAGLEAPVVEGG